MENIELLLPAGDKDSLRAAVANGADAVYLGLDAFNARRFAANFRRENLPSIVDFCHKNDVRVHVTANILVKNRELEDFFNLTGVIGRSGADAVILQDPWLIPQVKECAPDCEIHLSTQATTANIHAVPEGADRVIAPRELNLEQISMLAGRAPLEVFVHGALCLGYSGQCLFSSLAGGRSGNRGMCAQPCRYRYNGSYPLSTMDLCLLEKLPDIIETGVVALKVEGRMRGALYTGAVARIYRKYIDMHYKGKFRVDPKDLDTLKMAFNREFTTGFAFNDSIVDPDFGMNRGIYLGIMENGKVRLESDICAGDGIMAIHQGEKSGNIVNRIKLRDEYVDRAGKGEVVAIHVKGAREGDKIYKTSSPELTVDLGADFEMAESRLSTRSFKLPRFREERPGGQPSLFVKVGSPNAAREADRAGACVIYYDIFARDCQEAKDNVRNARFFLYTPGIMSDADIEKALDVIQTLKPDGVMAGERGLASVIVREKLPVELHLSHPLNVFNDIDLANCGGIPVISPELTLDELAGFRSKKFMVMAHGPMVVMTTREPIKARTLRDEAGRVFPVRRSRGMTEVLNCSGLGLFNLVKSYLDIGVKWFFLEPSGNVGKTVDIYRKIISGEPFNDKKIRKGYTTGHFRRGVD